MDLNEYIQQEEGTYQTDRVGEDVDGAVYDNSTLNVVNKEDKKYASIDSIQHFDKTPLHNKTSDIVPLGTTNI